MVKSKGSLRKKFIFIVSSLLLLSFFTWGALTYNTVSKNIRENVTYGAINFSDLGTKPIVELYELYFDSGYFKFFNSFDKIKSKTTDIKKVVIVNVDGKILFDSAIAQIDNYPEQEAYISKDLQKNLSSFEPVYKYTVNSKEYIDSIIVPYITEWGSHPYSVIYYPDYSEISTVLRKLIIETSLLIFIFLIITDVLINLFTHRTILSPLSNVIDIASKVARGELDVQSQIKQKDEIGDLSKAVNKIASELRQNIIDLEELDKLKSSFTDLIARNLRSPVKHIELDIDYIKSKLLVKLSLKEKAVLDDIEKANNQLKLMTEDLMNISSLKKQQITKLIPSPINLVEIITNLISEFKPEIKTKNITVKFATKLEKANTVADEHKIKQTIMNVLDNAIKYNQQNGIIEITLNKEEDYFVTSIKDTGKGISEDDQKRLFKPFNQSAGEDNKATKDSIEGTGLGLYLAKLIIDAHKGKIELTSKINEGTTVKLFLPIKNSNQ